jgi:hypothetical protein
VTSFREIAGKTTAPQLKRWGDWQDDWQSYLRYLKANHALSANFENRDGRLQLREGYYPPWTAKDFK